MKPALWVPTVVFLATSIPVALLLGAFDLGGDFRIWIAIVAGVVATLFAQSRLKSREPRQ